jgi:hypothetical protein
MQVGYFDWRRRVDLEGESGIDGNDDGSKGETHWTNRSEDESSNILIEERSSCRKTISS